MLYLNDHIDQLDVEASMHLLSDQRREQALRYRFELGRRTCVAAYLLLCEGLRKEYGITEPPVFEYNEHGKPSILGRPDIHFSLSHCREAAICILDSHPVGIDVESVHRYSESLARYTMNDRELQLISESPRPDIVFIRLWTQKEAVYKYLGTGIDNNIKTVLDNAPSLTTVVDDDLRYVYSYTSE